MNFLKKPENLMPLDSWLFGEDMEESKSTQTKPAPTSRPISPANPSTGQSSVLMLNPKLVAAATDAANKLQDTYKKMSTKALNSQYPLPLSKRFRKYLKAKEQNAKRADQLLLSPASYTRLRSYAPASLPEIVKDPKKLPYLLRFLSETKTTEGKTNYHQVLLFLIELEQQKGTRGETTQTPQLLKLFNKYFTKASEFSISETLELTEELEGLVLASIQSDEIGWLGFRPLQKLAYKRLAREELPRFLKSDEYLKMMIEIESNAAFVPIERFLAHRRAAHYFLLFLMQQRQHFELYVWLHVEYVLKPCASSNDEPSFWSLVTELEKKASVDSIAIQETTKKSLSVSVASQNLQATLDALQMAQKDIVLLLSASWYERFVKSHLYLLALTDRTSKRLLDSDSEDDDLPSYSQYDTDVSIPTSSLVHHEEESEDEDSDDSTGRNGSRYKLDLESIIRSTNLPSGLQVHYRPNFQVHAHTLSDLESSNGVDSIVLFKTSVERSSGLEVSYVRRDKSLPTTSEAQRKIQELAKRIQPFLVPHGQLSNPTEPPHDTLFPFLVLQNGHEDNLYGLSFYTSCLMDGGGYGVRGMCLLSTYPLLDSLRSMFSNHLRQHGLDRCMEPDIARGLYSVEKPARMTSMIPLGNGEEFTCEASRLGFLDIPPPPSVDFALDGLFCRLSSAITLEVLANALLEHSIILLSSSYTALTTCAEAIRALLTPFSWCHIYIPLLPKSLLSYLQCPTPILVGVHQSTTTRDDLPTPSDSSAAVVVDLDRGTLEYLGTRHVVWNNMGLRESTNKNHIRLVDSFHLAKEKLDALQPWTTNGYSDDIKPASKKCSQSRRAICYELVGSLLDHHNDASLVVGDANESVIMFDEKKFTSYRPSYESPFMECLVRTQSFSEIISTHRIDSRFESDTC